MSSSRPNSFIHWPRLRWGGGEGVVGTALKLSAQDTERPLRDFRALPFRAVEAVRDDLRVAFDVARAIM